MPGSPSRLVVTTGALRRLTDRQLEAVLTHERGHARARHDWLLHLSAALAGGFPKVPLFTHFCEQTHRLVELAADDTAARQCGHVTTALALIELNQHRGVLSCASSRRLLDDRVNRLLTPPPTLKPLRRTRIATAAALAPLLPLLITFAPGIDALG
jgi:Zn-dependent protease with chaperone function